MLLKMAEKLFLLPELRYLLLKIILTGWDMYRFYKAPMQQTVANADYTTSAIAYRDSDDGGDGAFYPIEPGIVLVGSKQNVLQVDLPAAMVAVESNSRAILLIRGHLAQNVTSVR
jgi:hypothetical protein